MTEREVPPHREFVVRLVDDSKHTSSQDIFKRIAELLGIAALLAGLILSLGWSYAYAWFQAWKMPLATLSIGEDHLFEYGRLAIVASLWIILPFVIVSAICLWLPNRYLPSLRSGIPLIMVVGLLLCWLGAHWTGKHAALADFERMIEGNFQLLPVAEILLKPDAKVPSDFARDIMPGRPCYRVIFASPEAVWLARTRDNNSDPLVAMLPRAQIVLLRLYPKQGNCPAGIGKDAS